MYPIAFIDLPPLLGASGEVVLPGSKSISNRVLLLAGLSEGVTLVRALLDSDDTRVMCAALRQLGCSLVEQPGGLSVTGIGGRLHAPADGSGTTKLFLGNAGTAMRPLTAALALLTAAQGGSFELGGVPRMHERPIGDLVDALRQLGCEIDYLAADGYPPLRLRRSTAAVGAATSNSSAPSIEGAPFDQDASKLDLSQPIRVRGDVSSQFLTALLLALPLVTPTSAAVIEVEGELISKPYIEITLNLLKRFGIDIVRDGWARFTIPRGSAYRSPGEILVEGDASSASYFVALGAIAAHSGKSITIQGVGEHSIQGDIRFVDAARAMGAIVETGAERLVVRRGAWPLQAVDLDCNHIPDAAMTLAVMALYATGTTRLRNIASWRVKETDRIAAMATELRKLGAQVVEGTDFIEIDAPQRWQAASIDTYDDHRMAMCGSLAAFNGLSAVGHASADRPVPVRIADPRCVGKTFPDYFETLFRVSSTTIENIPVIAVDGPSASGKGTVAVAVARALGYHFLDSGAVYRATALASRRAGIPATDEAGLASVAAVLDLRFRHGLVYLGSDEVTEELRREDIGALASKISAWPLVRTALRNLQLSFRKVPGLVADGRDMGTVIFPGANMKVFLTASAATRAERRHNQLIAKGVSSNIDSLRQELEERDLRDRSRVTAPLMPAEDALLLDNSSMTAAASVEVVLDWWQQRRPFSG